MAQRRRQDLIMELIQQNGFVTTEQLVDQFKVTPQTIRRDLNELVEQNMLRRHHGGAGIDSSTTNTAYQARKIMDLEAKERIAAALVKMIPDNSSMFINIGTTTETIARALLDKKNLQVVTNNLHVASILAAKEDFHVIIAGGEVRNRDGGIVGEATRDFINQFKMDFGIIGISGIHSDGSLLDFDYREGTGGPGDYRQLKSGSVGRRPHQVRPQGDGSPGQTSPKPIMSSPTSNHPLKSASPWPSTAWNCTSSDWVRRSRAAPP